MLMAPGRRPAVYAYRESTSRTATRGSRTSRRMSASDTSMSCIITFRTRTADLAAWKMLRSSTVSIPVGCFEEAAHADVSENPWHHARGVAVRARGVGAADSRHQQVGA